MPPEERFATIECHGGGRIPCKETVQQSGIVVEIRREVLVDLNRHRVSPPLIFSLKRLCPAGTRQQRLQSSVRMIWKYMGEFLLSWEAPDNKSAGTPWEHPIFTHYKTLSLRDTWLLRR